MRINQMQRVKQRERATSALQKGDKHSPTNAFLASVALQLDSLSKTNSDQTGTYAYTSRPIATTKRRLRRVKSENLLASWDCPNFSYSGEDGITIASHSVVDYSTESDEEILYSEKVNAKESEEEDDDDYREQSSDKIDDELSQLFQPDSSESTPDHVDDIDNISQKVIGPNKRLGRKKKLSISYSIPLEKVEQIKADCIVRLNLANFTIDEQKVEAVRSKWLSNVESLIGQDNLKTISNYIESKVSFQASSKKLKIESCPLCEIVDIITQYQAHKRSAEEKWKKTVEDVFLGCRRLNLETRFIVLLSKVLFIKGKSIKRKINVMKIIQILLEQYHHILQSKPVLLSLITSFINIVLSCCNVAPCKLYFKVLLTQSKPIPQDCVEIETASGFKFVSFPEIEQKLMREATKQQLLVNKESIRSKDALQLIADIFALKVSSEAANIITELVDAKYFTINHMKTKGLSGLFYTHMKRHEKSLFKPLLQASEMSTYLYSSRAQPTVCNLHPVELARQLTLIEQEFLHAIDPELDLHLNKKPAAIARYTAWINKLSYWVASEVVVVLKKKQRVALLKHLYDVAMACKEFNNFSSMVSIIHGLDKPALARMKRTWQALPRKAKKIKDELEALCSPINNFAALREEIKKQKLPIIPYFPIVAKDITQIDVGNSNFEDVNKTIINWPKFQLLSAQVKQFKRSQQKVYKFQPVYSIMEWISKSSVLNDKALQACSLSIERKQNRSLPTSPRSAKISKRKMSTPVRIKNIENISSSSKQVLDAMKSFSLTSSRRESAPTVASSHQLRLMAENMTLKRKIADMQRERTIIYSTFVMLMLLILWIVGYNTVTKESEPLNSKVGSPIARSKTDGAVRKKKRLPKEKTKRTAKKLKRATSVQPRLAKYSGDNNNT